MKFMMNHLEKMKPLFKPGGKLEKLYPLFEAQETFMFTPPTVTKSSPHIRDANDMKRTMITVIFALIPCILFGMYNAGRQHNIVNMVQNATLMTHLLQGALLVMPIIMASYVAGGIWEVLFAVVRKHEINEGFLVTGMLFPLTLPPTIPLWQVAVGISFGVIIGKEVFGGTGFNVLNPALTARAFLFFAYPQQISGDSVWTSVVKGGAIMDGFSGATPLAIAAQVPSGGNVIEALREGGFTWMSMFGGLEGGSIGETGVIPILIGAAILIITGVGAWRIMAGGVLGLFIGSTLMNFVGNAQPEFKAFTMLPFHYHLVVGSFLFGIVFMATDPVSASATNAGKWVYGSLIGLLTIVIRVTNPAYPEGVMLSILFMNVMAPLIDHIVVSLHVKRRASYLRRFSRAKG
ncbi:MAG: NADH:ubiquinone reductase (Na(+)-transporting) subunit B [Verrucomicrobia bacterium]|nr:NADH:ubiquinone reductase (Na(+)-transporting) subunit B [Verrucomicrobiota bacterium]